MDGSKTAANAQLGNLARYEPRFHDETDPSAFFSLIEWYAKVMFPNFEKTMRVAKKIKSASREIERKCSEEEIEAAGPFLRRGLELVDRLSDLHEEMNARLDWVIEAEEFSHRLSDELEVVNGDLLVILKCLRSVVVEQEIVRQEATQAKSIEDVADGDPA